MNTIQVIFLLVQTVLSCTLNSDIILTCDGEIKLTGINIKSLENILFYDIENTLEINLEIDNKLFKRLEYITLKNNSKLECINIERLKENYYVDFQGSCKQIYESVLVQARKSKVAVSAIIILGTVISVIVAVLIVTLKTQCRNGQMSARD